MARNNTTAAKPEPKLPEGKIPPQNLDAETSLLGAVLIDDEVLTRVSDKLKADDFYDKRHRLIFGAMVSLYEHHKPVDLLTLSDELKKNDALEASGGSQYLAELTNQVPTAAHAESYAEIISQNAMRRRLIAASANIAELGFDESKSTGELLENAEAHLFAVSDEALRQDLTSLEQILTESFDRMEELHRDKSKIRGVRTGYRDMDNLLAGFQRSDLIILAARPAMGKSTFALNLAHNVAVAEKQSVLVFSLEMSKEQLVDRMLADEAGVDAWNIRTGNLSDDDFEKLSNAMGVLAEAPIYIDDTPGVSVLELRTKARRAAHEHPLGLVVVDYLQLMSGSGKGYGDNRVQEISEISRGLKLVARELNVPVLALSQLSRSVESRNPPHPQLSDLRESGCLTGDTEIYMPETGQYIPLRELIGKNNFKISALNNKTWKLETGIVSKAFSTGIKPILRLKTKTGRTIRATGNHKFLTINGWKRLDEININDHLALPRNLSGSESRIISNPRLALLGHLIGDGCTLPRHAIQYTTKDSDLAEHVSQLAVQAFGEELVPKIKRERGWYQVYLSSATHLTHGKRNPVAKWLDDLGAFGLRSYEKSVPKAVFNESAEGIAIFLRHLWATDGCVKIYEGVRRSPAIYYASSSYKLAQGVQSLLLRFNINARLSSHPQKNKGRDQYHVTISGSSDIKKFITKIGAVGLSKQEQLDKICEHIENVNENTNRDVIPKEAWKLLAVPAMQQAGMTTRQLHTAISTAYCGTTLYKSNLSRQRAERVAKAVMSEELSLIASSDVYWDRVTKIEPDGVEEVFDLTVPGHHNFVANNIIVHNSIEQDADIVMFLYREDYYNPETERQHVTDVMVKKHRNGPTGNVELFFHPERLKFMSLDKRQN